MIFLLCIDVAKMHNVLMIDSYDWVMLMMMTDYVNVDAWNINHMIKNVMINIHAMFMMLWCATCYG